MLHGKAEDEDERCLQVEPGNDQQEGHQAVYHRYLGEGQAPPPLLLVAHSGACRAEGRYRKEAKGRKVNDRQTGKETTARVRKTDEEILHIVVDAAGLCVVVRKHGVGQYTEVAGTYDSS